MGTVSLEKHINKRLKSMNKATKVALKELNRRLDGMNEFRDTIKDQNAEFIRKSEHDTAHSRIEEDIRSLRESRAEISGKASKDDLRASEKLANKAILIAAISAVITGISVIVTIFALLKE